MKTNSRIVLSIITALMFIFLAGMVYLLVGQEKCDVEDSVDDNAVVFRTDKKEYKSGQNITFILENNGTEAFLYDTELMETLQIFEPGGEIVVMVPYWTTQGLSNVQPGEELTWTWNQTYYLYVQEWGEMYLTFDYRSWTQVTSERSYTARIVFGDLVEEVDFRIID